MDDGSLPSGNLLQVAIEHGHRNSGFSHSMVIFHSFLYVYQRVFVMLVLC